MNTETIDLKAQLLADFDTFEAGLNGASKSELHQKRRAALAKFDAVGFPTPKNEEWKYSNVRTIVGQSYHFNAEGTVTAEQLDSLRLPQLEANILYFINGKYSPEHSTVLSPAEQLSLLPLSEALVSKAELVQTYFSTSLSNPEDAFTNLNTAFAQEGVFIHVPKGKVVEHPVLLRFINDASHENVGSQPRNLVIVEANAQVKWSESFHTLGAHASLTNAFTEVFVAPDALVEYYKIQDDSDASAHIGTTQVYVQDRGHFYSATVSLNGGFIRNNLNIVMDGEYCDVFMYGLYLPSGKQLIDNHTIADHRKPNSQSNELYKGVLRGKSTGVFNGKIFVREDAQKTNAFQSCKNVVLSPEATMNTKPQLEIFADDVKCSHGTTTGQLDEEALFYMRSRGISKVEAQTLLVSAFCEDVVSQIKIEPLQAYLVALMNEKLTQS